MKTGLTLLLLLGWACSGLGAPLARESQEEQIREALFRHQFEHNDSYQQKRAKVFFLSVGEQGADPSDQLMKRFADHRPPIRKVSASTVDLQGRVVDKQTGELGVIFKIEMIRWVSDAEVEVKGGYHEFPRSASENTYTVKKEQNKWTVTKDMTDREA